MRIKDVTKKRNDNLNKIIKRNEMRHFQQLSVRSFEIQALPNQKPFSVFSSYHTWSILNFQLFENSLQVATFKKGKEVYHYLGILTLQYLYLAKYADAILGDISGPAAAFSK